MIHSITLSVSVPDEFEPTNEYRPPTHDEHILTKYGAVESIARKFPAVENIPEPPLWNVGFAPNYLIVRRKQNEKP